MVGIHQKKLMWAAHQELHGEAKDKKKFPLPQPHRIKSTKAQDLTSLRSLRTKTNNNSHQTLSTPSKWLPLLYVHDVATALLQARRCKALPPSDKNPPRCEKRCSRLRCHVNLEEVWQGPEADQEGEFYDAFLLAQLFRGTRALLEWAASFGGVNFLLTWATAVHHQRFAARRRQDFRRRRVRKVPPGAHQGRGPHQQPRRRRRHPAAGRGQDRGHCPQRPLGPLPQVPDQEVPQEAAASRLAPRRLHFARRLRAQVLQRRQRRG